MTVKPQNVTLGEGIQVGVFALFGGHHAVWASGSTQADICNNADDLVVLDCSTGRKHRFPITTSSIRWIRQLLATMNGCDRVAGSPWADHNVMVRGIMITAANGVLNGNEQQLNILNPPLIAPALAGAASIEVDEYIRAAIAAHPESLIT